MERRRRRRHAWIVRAGCVAAMLCGPAVEHLIAPAPVVVRPTGTTLIDPGPSRSTAPLSPRTRPPRHRTVRAIPPSSPPGMIVTPLASLPGTTIDAAAPLVTVLPSRLRLPSHVDAIDAPPMMPIARTPLRPPRVLVPLYVSFGTLQVLDYHSTQKALSSGAGREANPLARGIVTSPPALIVAKAAATAGVIVAGEKMWKKNRVGAVVFVATMNAAMSVIVAHNYSVTK